MASFFNFSFLAFVGITFQAPAVCCGFVTTHQQQLTPKKIFLSRLAPWIHRGRSQSMTNVEDWSSGSLAFLHPAACIVGPSTAAWTGDVEELEIALKTVGFETALVENKVPDDIDIETSMYRYSYSKATGMLKLLSSPSKRIGDVCNFSAQSWVPIVKGEENVLVANGWSFLDIDPSELISSFDIDAANIEGQYMPKWGVEEQEDGARFDDLRLGQISTLGFCISNMSTRDILSEAEMHLSNDLSRTVLLEGGTDPPKRKRTHNDFDFSGSVRQLNLDPGVFVCAIGGLPLFSTSDLSPSTATSGWLSFARAVADDHVVCIQPETHAVDQRVEVVCAKSGCHLGHYFGKTTGFCINASALNFIPNKSGVNFKKVMTKTESLNRPIISPLISWRSMEEARQTPSLTALDNAMRMLTRQEVVVLGGGCFWHFEFALRRLPGVIDTMVGYAGGTVVSPSYEDVCKKETGHAEVVRVTFDPMTLDKAKLFDCFLAMHDPTVVRAHGKRSPSVGQYRSCIFVLDNQTKGLADQALSRCKEQLKKDLSTEVRLFPGRFGSDLEAWFWPAEQRHQRHDERRKVERDGSAETSTLSVVNWLSEYGKRPVSRIGSSETLQMPVDILTNT